jgi:chemotaxis protein methyltransferase CheR
MFDPVLDFEIKIVDYRNIIKVIKDTYGYDFSEYALISLKRRFERVIQLHNFRYTDSLIAKLREDKLFFQNFLQEISVESTEMFRDPSMWRYFRDEFFPMLLADNFKLKIWIPNGVSGDELYSLCIMLHENGWLQKCEIVVTCLNDQIIDVIKKGSFKSYKVEVSNDNYARYQGKGLLSDYYKKTNDQYVRDSSLIKNVSFIKQNINFDKPPQDVRLVLCRNQLIYYTQGLHDKILKVFYDSLMTGGYLALGVKEQVGLISSRYYKVVNELESIYKKI